MCTSSKACSKCSACSVKRKKGVKKPTKKQAMSVIAKLPASRVKRIATQMSKKR